MTEIIIATAGFLIAVLWFDLMFDVQVARHRDAAELPEQVLASIASYYRRVTTTASPMGRLVGVVMFVLIVGLITQAVRRDAPVWVSAISLPASLFAIGLALGRVFGDARRLGTRADPPGAQTRLARGVFLGHMLCLPAMTTVLAVQLAGA